MTLVLRLYIPDNSGFNFVKTTWHFYCYYWHFQLCIFWLSVSWCQGSEGTGVPLHSRLTEWSLWASVFRCFCLLSEEYYGREGSIHLCQIYITQWAPWSFLFFCFCILCCSYWLTTYLQLKFSAIANSSLFDSMHWHITLINNICHNYKLWTLIWVVTVDLHF